ncbi:hypothetical protein GSI_04761 [Ganoderma sinense ZZ0214-1]|uniref:Uncharacterized protein n=1 Tax=Ganoderma sinense ZZ0214-1 TaxID=1077348 RepID=A0A2G8SHS9_9APHY|nr:hypothetical protein GSI_04761 [Ganoderma sinense ZZ0214-1]
MSEKKDTSTCTCGQCFEGWLSPKMRECLEYSAELRYELAKSLLETQEGVGEGITGVLPIDYTHIDGTSVRYLPAAVRTKLSPSNAGASHDPKTADEIYRGYVAVFKVVRDLSRSEDSGDGDGDGERAGKDEESESLADRGFPTISAVAAELQTLRASGDPVDAFLAHGGGAEHALDCVVHRAREELTPLGRQYDSEKRYIDEMFAGEHAECANDLDFALVRARLGLPEETLGVDLEVEEDEEDPLSDDEE